MTRRYIALWAGAFAGIVLLGLIAVGLGMVIRTVIADPNLWWIPLMIFSAALLATVVVSVDYLTTNAGEDEEPGA